MTLLPFPVPSPWRTVKQSDSPPGIVCCVAGYCLDRPATDMGDAASPQCRRSRVTGYMEPARPSANGVLHYRAAAIEDTQLEIALQQRPQMQALVCLVRVSRSVLVSLLPRTYIPASHCV